MLLDTSGQTAGLGCWDFGEESRLDSVPEQSPGQIGHIGDKIRKFAEWFCSLRRFGDASFEPLVVEANACPKGIEGTLIGDPPAVVAGT
jgi:hypothetical protein